MKLTIGIDIDDTKANTMHDFLTWYNRMCSRNLKKGDLTNYELRHALECSAEEERAFISEFFCSEDGKRIAPNRGSQSACLRLGQNYKLVSITSRPTVWTEQTNNWIRQNYPANFSGVHLTNGYAEDGHKRTKAEICREFGVSVMIDDAPHIAEECFLAGIPIILIDQPWNQLVNYSGVHRVGNWERENWWENGIFDLVERLVNLSQPPAA